MSFDIKTFESSTNVSRETLSDYAQWHTELLKWNARINLVSKAAIEHFWERHAFDSWQITQHIPQGDIRALDLGSGAGFPGIAVAIEFKVRGEGQGTMIESVGKKANFLRTLIRTQNLPSRVLAERAEDVSRETYDLITARAFASLDKTLGYAALFWGEGTIALLHKGENYEEELTEAYKSWHFDSYEIPSQSHESGVILKISGLRRR